jgi:hypothetical protein
MIDPPEYMSNGSPSKSNHQDIKLNLVDSNLLHKQTLESEYTQYGLTAPFVEKQLARLKARLAQAELSGNLPYLRLPYSDCFYLDSSDALACLNKVDVSNKRVLSVAGSGEFMQLFINRGASRVDIYDISWLAALWNELKMIGLINLNYDDYRTMFDTWKKTIPNQSIPIFDKNQYQKIRQFLSEPAQKFFDLLTSEEYKKLFYVVPNNLALEGLIRARGGNTFIGTVIKDTETYEELQKKARQVDWHIQIQDIEDVISHVDKETNTVYMSDIGYTPEGATGLVRKFLKTGVKRIVCAWAPRHFTKSSDKYLDSTGQIHKMDWTSLSQNYEPIPEYKGVLLVPGASFTIDGVKVTVVDNDPKGIFGLIVEIKREENE